MPSRSRTPRKRLSVSGRPRGLNVCHGAGMRRVYLLRHAKSSWKDRPPRRPRLAPLAGRGKRQLSRPWPATSTRQGIRADLALFAPRHGGPGEARSSGCAGRLRRSGRGRDSRRLSTVRARPNRWRAYGCSDPGGPAFSHDRRVQPGTSRTSPSHWPRRGWERARMKRVTSDPRRSPRSHSSANEWSAIERASGEPCRRR